VNLVSLPEYGTIEVGPLGHVLSAPGRFGTQPVGNARLLSPELDLVWTKQIGNRIKRDDLAFRGHHQLVRRRAHEQRVSIVHRCVEWAVTDSAASYIGIGNDRSCWCSSMICMAISKW
jgi:hypothetical protein